MPLSKKKQIEITEIQEWLEDKFLLSIDDNYQTTSMVKIHVIKTDSFKVRIEIDPNQIDTINPRMFELNFLHSVLKAVDFVAVKNLI
jgi:hypothetical protein